MTAPLVPGDVDLRGLPWMRLDTSRLLDSDLFALSTGDEFKAAVALWCKAWTQAPAGSLPTDDRVLAHLSGAGPRWKKVKAMALRGWVMCDDGRMYHPVVSEQVLAAWAEREGFRARLESQNARQRSVRDERSAKIADLKAAGVHLAWNAPMHEVRTCHANLPKPVTVTDGTCHSDCHGIDGTGRDGKSKKQELPPPPLEDLYPDQPVANPPDCGGGCTAAQACAAMIRGGAQPERLNHADPRLLAACAAGATAVMFEATAVEANGHDPPKSPGWIFQAVLGRLSDAKSANAATRTHGAIANATARQSATDRVLAAIQRGQKRDMQHDGAIDAEAVRLPR